MASHPEDEEAVNGKIDLGVKKLVATFIENATTFYGYSEADSNVLKSYTEKLADVANESVDSSDLKEGKMYLVYSEKDKCWARGRVEQLKAGQNGGKIRTRLVDIGRGDYFDNDKFRQLPVDFDESKMPVICCRFKMADLKPKGRDEGFSAQDREKGAEWFRALVKKHGPVIKAKCHKIVNYKGGVMFEGEIGGKNINQMALMQGLAVPNPNLMAKNPQPQFMMRPPFPGPRPPFQPQRPYDWDVDYLEYGGRNMRNGHHNQKKGNNNNNDNFGGGYLPVPGGYNPYKINEPAKKDDPAKLRQTLQALGVTLSKRNKEIAELKRSEESFGQSQTLAETVARVQALRLGRSKKEDERTREKVADTARLVRDLHHGLTLLAKKGTDADRAVAMLTQCREQMRTIEDAEPLEVTLDVANKGVAKFAGTYMVEYENMRGNLDDGCAVLQDVLDNDVPGPRVKLNVGQLEAAKRTEVVEVAAQMADAWAKEDRKENAKVKSDEALTNLIQGLNEIAGGLQGAANGQGLPQGRSLPNLAHLTKKAAQCYNTELGMLSPPGSAAAESVANNYASVMATLAKAIAICLAEKKVAEEKFQKYADIQAKNY